MNGSSRKVVIIGGGIAGLCAGVYARKCGYAAEILEMHEVPGGLATSWHRGGYTFETCLNWLLGSAHGRFHALWQEVFDIDRLTFINQQDCGRIETEHGEFLTMYADLDRLETTLLAHAPQDAAAVRSLVSTIRRFARFNPPLPGSSRFGDALTFLRLIPWLPALRRLMRVTIADYGQRFKGPLLRSFFNGDSAELSALPLILSMAWMFDRNAGYPIGGSQAVIGAIADNFCR